MPLLFFVIFTCLLFGLIIGIYIGARLKTGSYNGYMVAEETPEGLKYRLELAGDPELLIFQDVVIFKVIPPDYQDLLSREKLGV